MALKEGLVFQKLHDEGYALKSLVVQKLRRSILKGTPYHGVRLHQILAKNKKTPRQSSSRRKCGDS